MEIATLMDLSKAFGCVDHNILISKLKRYGIHETALQWINSFLSDSEQYLWGRRLDSYFFMDSSILSMTLALADLQGKII